MHIYLDESGDLGFRTGSSKYLILAFIAIQNPKKLKRCIRDVKVKYRIPQGVEIKADSSRHIVRLEVLRRLSRLDIEVHSIILNKCNVKDRLQRDKNILYNYTAGFVLIPFILKQKEVSIFIDKRTIKVTSGFKFDEYLKYKVWYEKLKTTEMRIKHLESHTNYGIQAIDFVCYSLFRKYEKDDRKYYDLIKDKIVEEKKLFF